MCCLACVVPRKMNLINITPRANDVHRPEKVHVYESTSAAAVVYSMFKQQTSFNASQLAPNVVLLT